jgi:hypothetical protein
MNIRALAVVGVVAVAVVVVGAAVWWTNHLTTWKCFKVDEELRPTPHTEPGDEYCLAYRGPQNNIKWYLVPGLGMENWKGIGGDSRIRLTATTDEDDSKIFEFDLKVIGHGQGSGHGDDHKKPDFGYELTVIVRPAPDLAEATFTVAGGPSVHAGSAHSNED